MTETPLSKKMLTRETSSENNDSEQAISEELEKDSDIGSMTSHSEAKEKGYTVPEMVVDPSTSVHYTTPITVAEEVVEVADAAAAAHETDGTSAVAAHGTDQIGLNGAAANNTTSLLMSKYVMQGAKGFSRVDNMHPGKFTGLFGSGDRAHSSGGADTADAGGSDLCIVYPQKTAVAAQQT